MWALKEALKIVRALQPDVHEAGYHVTLGGGVLNTGASDKDLDLFVLRKNNVERVRQYLVVDAICVLLGARRRALRDNPDYGGEQDFHFKEAFTLTLDDGRRIDLFVQ